MPLSPTTLRRQTRNSALLRRFYPGLLVRRRQGSLAVGVILRVSSGPRQPLFGWQRPPTAEELQRLWANSTPKALVAFRRPIAPNCRGGMVRWWVALSRLEVIDP